MDQQNNEPRLLQSSVAHELCVFRIAHHAMGFLRDRVSHLTPERQLQELIAWLNEYAESESKPLNERLQKPLGKVSSDCKDNKVIVSSHLTYGFASPYPPFHLSAWRRAGCTDVWVPSTYPRYQTLVIGNFGISPAHPSRSQDLRIIDVDSANFNYVLAARTQNLEIETPGDTGANEALHMHLNLQSLEDFAPEVLARQIESLKGLLADRGSLVDLASYADIDAYRLGGIDHFIAMPDGIGSLIDLSEAFEEVANSNDPVESQVVAAALRGWRRNDLVDSDHYYSMLGTLAKWATNSPDLLRNSWPATLRVILRSIDALISKTLNVLLHSPRMRGLESSWRGLYELVRRAEGCGEIHLLSLTWNELKEQATSDEPCHIEELIRNSLTYRDLKYDCIIVDYDFFRDSDSMRILDWLASIAARLETHVLVGASHEFLRLSSWADMHDKASITSLLESEEFSEWRRFRGKPHALSLSVVFPPFRSRKRYVPDGNLATIGFSEELVEGDDFPVRSNSAYLVAAEQAFMHHAREIARSGGNQSGPISGTGTTAEQLMGPIVHSLIDNLHPGLRNLGLLWPTRIEYPFFTDPLGANEEDRNGAGEGQ